MKYLIFPLLVIIFTSILSMLGLGSSTLQDTQYIYLQGDASSGFYDSTDHMVAYANRSAYDETGTITKVYQAGQNQGPWSMLLYWVNSTGTYNIFDNTGERFMEKDTAQFDILTPDGLLAIIAVAIVGGGIGFVALTFFGGSDVSVAMVVFGTILLGMWGIFSLISYGLIASIPLMGGIFWFILTLIYSLGILQMVRGNGT